MKKRISAIILTLVLCISFCACLFGCGGGAEFNGNFNTEATDENYSEVMTSILESDGELFGDETSADWATGLKVALELAYTRTGADQDVALSAKGDFTFVVSKDSAASSGYSAAGKGWADISANGLESLAGALGAPEGAFPDTALYKGDMFVDNTNFYIGGKFEVGETKVEGKYVVEDFYTVSDLMEAIEDINAGYGELDMSSEDVDDAVDEIMAVVEALEIKVYIDTSNGVKVKVSLSNDTLETIAEDEDLQEMIPEDLRELAVSLLEADLSINKFDLYFSLTSDYEFAGIKLDVDVSRPATATTPAESLKIMFSVTDTESKPALPTDLDTYSDISTLGESFS